MHAFTRWLLLHGALALVLSIVSEPAAAQGKKGDSAPAAAAKPSAPVGKKVKAKKVTTKDAVVVVRDVLVVHGYKVVRVEHKNGAEIIYFRRGNNGRGRGLGPVEKMVVRPKGDLVVFESAPSKVLVDVNVRLGL